MSVNTSLSLWCNSRASVGRNCRTTLNLGGGFLFLHRLDKVHVMFLRKPAYWHNKIYHKWKDDYQCRGTRLFNLSEEQPFYGDVKNIHIGSLASAACHIFFSFSTGQQFTSASWISLPLLHIFIYNKSTFKNQSSGNLISQCHVQFLILLTGVSVSISLNRGSTIPASVTKSRRSGPSPTKHDGQWKNFL